MVPNCNENQIINTRNPSHANQTEPCESWKGFETLELDDRRIKYKKTLKSGKLLNK